MISFHCTEVNGNVKKTISILLILIALLSLFACSDETYYELDKGGVSRPRKAEDYDDYDDDDDDDDEVEYSAAGIVLTDLGGSYEVSGISDYNHKDIVIPSSYKGKPIEYDYKY